MLEKERAASDKLAAGDELTGGASSSAPIIHRDLGNVKSLLQALALQFTTTPGPGEERPDPATLGDPQRYNSLSPFVALLQHGMAPPDVLAMMSPELRAIVAATDPSRAPAPPLDLLTADQILTAVYPDPVWAIPGLLPAGLALLAGKPKIGKSPSCKDSKQNGTTSLCSPH